MPLLRIVIMLVEFLLLFFLMLMAFLITGWIEDDSFAVTASEIDWWIVAGQRLIFTSVLSLIAAVFIWRVNNSLFVLGHFGIERLPIISGIIVFVCLFISAVGGAIYFAVWKPFI